MITRSPSTSERRVIRAVALAEERGIESVGRRMEEMMGTSRRRVETCVDVWILGFFATEFDAYYAGSSSESSEALVRVCDVVPHRERWHQSVRRHCS